MKTPTNIETHVISWPGQENDAESIAIQLRQAGHRSQVIHAISGKNGNGLPAGWALVEGAGYGRIMAKSLEISNSEVLLHIHADCSAENWSEVVDRCARLFSEHSSLGVWSPLVDWSSWTLSRTKLGPGPVEGTHSVTTVDGIVWAFNSTVRQRLRALDYSSNPTGWGVDIAASSIAHKLSLEVVMDDSVVVLHPRGSGYNHDEAGVEADKFSAQLDGEELEIYRWIIQIARQRIASEKSAVHYRAKRALSKMREKLLDPVYKRFLTDNCD
jgi:hypothetical protein